MLMCRPISRIIAAVLVCAFTLSGMPSYAVTDTASDFALAPPSAIQSQGNTPLRDEWIIAMAGELVYPILKLTQEGKYQNPTAILIPHIKKNVDMAKMLLRGFDIDGMKEVREGQAITGFSLPITRSGTPAYRLVYNLQGGETNIPMHDGTRIYVKIERATTETVFIYPNNATTEELSHQSVQSIVNTYLTLKGEPKKEKAEFMARYGNTFNNIFMQRLENDPSDNEALFYFTQVRDLEVFYQIQQLRATIAERFRIAIDEVLRNIQFGIAISPTQAGDTTVVGYIEKHRLDSLYKEFVLPLASQINQDHPVRITQYASADGTTSVDLAELLQQAGIKANVLSTDLVINLNIVHDADDSNLIGIFDDFENLIQIKYKGRCYLPEPTAERKKQRIKHRIDQLNIFNDRVLCRELSNRLTKQFKSSSRIKFSRTVMTDNPQVSFASRDIFSSDYKEDADIVTVGNLFQGFSPATARKAMSSLTQKLKNRAYVVVMRASIQHKEYGCSVWQKQDDKLLLLKSFGIPVTKNDTSAYRLAYNLQDSETAIRTKDGRGINVKTEAGEAIQYDKICVSLTNYCPNRCPMCFMQATPYRKDSVSLSSEDIDLLLEYIKKKGFKTVELTGGEPLAEMEKLIKVIQYAETESIYIFTSGAFAINDRNAKRILDLVASALKERARIGKKPVRLFMRVSVDEFHFRVPQEKIMRIVKLFEQYHQSKYNGMELRLKGILTADDPIPSLAGRLKGEIRDEEKSSPFPFKYITLPSGFAFEVEYGELKLTERTLREKLQVRDYAKIYPKRLGSNRVLVGGDGNNISMTVSHNGMISIHEYVVASLLLANLKDKDFMEKVERRLLTDSLIVALRNEGLDAVLAVLNNAGSNIAQKALKANNQFLVISEILAKDDMKRYVYEKLNKLVRDKGWIKEKVKTLSAPVSPESERIHATNFQDMLTYIQVQPQSQGLIIALGTSWIKGYEKGRYLQYDALNPLIGSLRTYCESKGIPFVVDSDDKLLARINAERAKKGKTGARVVVLAGKETVTLNEFATLRNDERGAFVVGVDNQELTVDSYIRLMEMLTLALKLFTGFEITQDSTPIKIVKDDKLHIYIFIPRAEPMKYEQLKMIYEVQKFA